MKSTVLRLLLLMMFFSSVSVGQNNDLELQRSWDLSIGMGYGNLSNPFAGADDIRVPVTLDISWYGEKFFFDNGELGFTLIDRPKFGLNVITTYNSERLFYSFFNNLGLKFLNNGVSFSTVNQPVVDIEQDPTLTIIIPNFLNVDSIPLGNFAIPFNLPDRNFSLNLGLEAIHDTSFGTFSYQISKDVIAAHTGFDFKLDFTRSWTYGRWGFIAQTGLHWKSRELVDYYYGVDFRIFNFALQYQGESTIDASVGFTINYRLNNQWSAVSSYRYTHFGPGIDNSPLTKDSHKYTLFTGLVYQF